MVKFILFLFVSAGIVVVSWPSFRNRRTHGFYRFFAFEIILILVLSNVDRWFREPFSMSQCVSWMLLTCSLGLAIHGFYLLQVIGRPQGNFENTTSLVVTGAYRFIRHPLYASLIFLTWGVFFKDLSVLGILLSIVASTFLFATAKAEESENTAKFGGAYEEYSKSTRMFIPYVF